MPVDEGRPRSPQTIPEEEEMPCLGIKGMGALCPLSAHHEHIVNQLLGDGKRIMLAKDPNPVPTIRFGKVACRTEVCALHSPERIKSRMLLEAAESVAVLGVCRDECSHLRFHGRAGVDTWPVCAQSIE